MTRDKSKLWGQPGDSGNSENMDTRGIRIDYGKHNGELMTRLPISYIRWMINEKAPMWEYAKAEFDRRGDTMPKVEISGHAIDKASLRVINVWRADARIGEGIYSWLQRIVLEALARGKKKYEDTYFYLGMKLIIVKGEEYPSLKTIMRGRDES